MAFHRLHQLFLIDRGEWTRYVVQGVESKDIAVNRVSRGTRSRIADRIV